MSRPGERLEKALTEIVRKLEANKLNVGFFEGETYPDGTSLPMVAAVQEFGAAIDQGTHTVVIPPRPFMRNTVAHNKSGWGKLLGDALRASDMDVKKAFGTLGEKVKDQMQAEIIATTDPPNAPSTIAKKGFATPLRASGRLLQGVEFEVVSE